MGDPLVHNTELGAKLDDGIKKAFRFPFWEEDTCAPDGSKHCVPDRTFSLNGHFVVLYDIRLFPGLTFRALEASTGDLNVFTQEAKFEIDIPMIAGFFYVVSEDKSVKPVHITGNFKINYGSAIAKGITGFCLTDESLGISNLAMDFELVEKPNVTLYSREADGSMGPLTSDRAVNSVKVADVLWPSVHPLLYWILRDKLWNVASKISWDYQMGLVQFNNHETRRRSKVVYLLNDILVNVKRALAERTNNGRYGMPNIDVMVAPVEDPDTWGRFKTNSGWLGNVLTMNVENAVVHARSHTELVIIGHIKFDDLRFGYDEYTIETNNGNSVGQIVRILNDNEAVVTITAIRNSYGQPVVKCGRFEYINATDTNNEISGADDFDWLNTYIDYWMSGVMDAGKPVLNKLINDCLSDALVDADLFAFWDQLHDTMVHVTPSAPPIGFIVA